MASSSRKRSREVSKLFKGLSPEDKKKSTTAHRNMERTYKTEHKIHKKELRKDENYGRNLKSAESSYGTHYIQDLPPHKWVCSCGGLNYGNVESKIGNAAVVRCRHCDSTTVREIKLSP